MKGMLGGVLACLLLAGGGAPAWAKGDPAVKALWGKQCSKGEEGKPSSCVVRQFVVGQPGNRQLLLVQFSYDGPQKKPRMVLSAPLGILLLGGMTLSIDGKKPLTVPFETCNSGGCMTVIDMDAPALEQFRKGRVLMVRYLVGDKKPLDLPVNLDGLDAALKSIAP